jgi:HTH-type transcriptional regulator, competence development regulator
MTDDNNQILEQFGTILKQLRLEKKLTLLDLEVRSGVTEGDISRIENGKKNFNFTTLVKLAKGLEIPVSKLLSKFNA